MGRIIATYFAVLALLFVANSSVNAATFEFDLTESARDSALEAAIDLETAFQHIDSASVQIAGTFTPGLVTGVTIPPLSGPVIPSDTVNLVVRLGETGTAWIDKQTYAIQDLQGMSGDIQMSMLLRATMPPSRPTDLPVFMPSGDLDPNYSFLLDGKFGLSFSSIYWLVASMQSLESPRFELSSFVLKVEGVAVPEPTPLLLAMTALALVHKRTSFLGF